MQKTMIYWAVGALVFDQLSKLLVVFYLDLRTLLYLEVVPPFLNFAMAWNWGQAACLHPRCAKMALGVIALFISGLVVVWIRRDPPSCWAILELVSWLEALWAMRWIGLYTGLSLIF